MFYHCHQYCSHCRDAQRITTYRVGKRPAIVILTVYNIALSLVYNYFYPYFFGPRSSAETAAAPTLRRASLQPRRSRGLGHKLRVDFSGGSFPITFGAHSPPLCARRRLPPRPSPQSRSTPLAPQPPRSSPTPSAAEGTAKMTLCTAKTKNGVSMRDAKQNTYNLISVM